MGSPLAISGLGNVPTQISFPFSTTLGAALVRAAVVMPKYSDYSLEWVLTMTLHIKH